MSWALGGPLSLAIVQGAVDERVFCPWLLRTEPGDLGSLEIDALIY